MRYVILFVTFLALVGCEKEQPPAHPNQQAVDRAEKTTGQALKKAEDAERQLQHERRLRDLEKAKYDTGVADARSELVTWRGLLIGLSIVLVIVLLLLAREMRLRRTLAHLFRAQSANREEAKDE